MTHSDFLPASKPLLWDVRSCEEWLARATLADSRQACAAFLDLLDEIEDAPPRHAAYLQILERLREPILLAQEESSKKFAAKPLPLGHVEAVIFNQACDLWLALLRAYQRLLRAASKGGRLDLEPAAALLAERAIEYVAELISAHFVARRIIGEDLWHWLHEAYALAERRGLADVAVAESGSRLPSSSTCSAAYARPLMLALAHPYGWREREFTFARRWTRRWAEKARIIRERPGDGGYGIDLAVALGPAWKRADGAAESTRYLDLSKAARSIKWRLNKLDEGVSPAELGLGSDCAQAAAGELLAALAAAWTRPPKSRQFPRRATGAITELASGLAQIHAAFGGEFLPAATSQWDYRRHDIEQIQVFQRAVDLAARGEQHAPTVEQWETLDESATGFRLRRHGPGARLTHRQLVALRPRGARQFILCELRWLFQDADQSVTVGASAIVGMPRAIAVRLLAEDPAKPAPFSHALVLPVARDLPASLVLPAGWHQPGRVIELRIAGEMLRVKLTELLARGHDFDHSRFDIGS